MKHSGKLYLATLLKLSLLMMPTRALRAQACECGRPGKYYKHVQTRIINGDQTTPHEYPWMALLLYRGKAYCGGSVINNLYILTAAHCVVGLKRHWLNVALGVHDRITMDSGRARIYTVDQVIVHPQYTDRGYYDENDVALLKVSQPIIFDHLVRPVCLPYRGEDFTGNSAIVTGWGSKDINGFSDRFLQETVVEVLSDRDCTLSKVGNLYKQISSKTIMSQVLCAYQRNADSCQGDSGGPLVTSMVKNLMVQIGVVSFGKLCADIGSPGVYAKVSYFVNWIMNTTTDAMYCDESAYRRVTKHRYHKHYGHRGSRRG